MNIIELTDGLYWGGLLGFVLGMIFIFVVFTKTRNVRWMDTGIVIAALGVVAMLSYGLLWNQRLEARAFEAVTTEHQVTAEVVTIYMGMKVCVALHYACQTYEIPYMVDQDNDKPLTGLLVCPGDQCYLREKN